MFSTQKPLSALTTTELAVTQANCPGLVHAFNWANLTENGSNYNVVDLIGDVAFNLGLIATSVSAGPDAYSYQSSTVTVDTALVSGNWVNPGTKHCIIISMHGDAASLQVFIVGASGAAAVADGLRVNRTTIQAFDFSATATGSGTNLASTDSGAMNAMRLSPGSSINSLQVDDTTVTVNTQSTTTIPATIDGLNDVIGLTANVPYWGQLILHLDNLPTDQAIAEAMAFMRPRWSAGEFVLAPNMLGWS